LGIGSRLKGKERIANEREKKYYKVIQGMALATSAS
jgi:hypothetical protein